VKGNCKLGRECNGFEEDLKEKEKKEKKVTHDE